MATFNGGRLSETLLGTGFRDLLRGRGGDDVLIGAGDDDRLFGGVGNDLLVADGGEDRLSGGSGADRFVLLDGREQDVIRDFQAREDVIDLVGLGVRSEQQLRFRRDDEGAVTVFFRDHSLRVEGEDLTVRQVRNAIDYADKEILKFEGLRPRGEFADGDRLDDFQGYRGFQWLNFGVIDTRAARSEIDSGYKASSGRVALYTTGTSVLQDDEPFDFESVRAAGAWRDGLKVVFTGYAGAETTGSQTFTLGRHGRLQTLELDDEIFDAVSRVEITSYGGRRTPDTSSDWVNVSLDDFVLFT